MRLWLGVLVLAICPVRVHAQEELGSPSVSITGGVERYRFSDAGERRSGAVVALRLASPFVPLGIERWLVEGGLAYNWYRADDGDLRHLLVTELQLQWQPLPGAVRPFIGVGGGFGATRVVGHTTLHITGSASGGIRFLFNESWNLIAEGRLRRINLFKGTSPELTAGLLVRLR
jgi:hypothetical protein